MCAHACGDMHTHTHASVLGFSGDSDECLNVLEYNSTLPILRSQRENVWELLTLKLPRLSCPALGVSLYSCPAGTQLTFRGILM